MPETPRRPRAASAPAPRRQRLVRLSAAAACALAAGLAPRASAAPLTFDLRAASVTTAGVTLPVLDPKSVTTAVAGSVVTLNLYAVLAGANATHADDGFLLTHGSFASSSGGLQGNLRGDTGTAPTLTNNAPNFNQGVAQSGFQANLDADTDLDVGSLATTGSPSPLPYFVASAGTNPFFGTGAGAGNTEFLIGTTTFTLTGAAVGSTQVNYLPRVKTDGLAGQRALDQFTLDGTAFAVAGNDPAVAVAAPVTIAVPEPAALPLLAAAAALAARRRNRRG